MKSKLLSAQIRALRERAHHRGDDGQVEACDAVLIGDGDYLRDGLALDRCKMLVVESVADPDIEFASTLGSAPWSSPEARAASLLPICLAQLGTAGTDRTGWVRRIVTGGARRIIPIAMRAAAAAHPVEHHQSMLRAVAVRCETDGLSVRAAKDSLADATKAAREALDEDAAQASYAAGMCTALAIALEETSLTADVLARVARDTATLAILAADAVVVTARADETVALDTVLSAMVDVAVDAYSVR